MNEVVIGWDWTSLITPIFLWRVVSVMIGCGVLAHFLLMSGYAKPKTPYILRLAIAASAGIGAYIIVDAVRGGPDWTPMMALVLAPVLAFLLWIWDKGFHMCEFVDRFLEQKNSVTDKP